MDMVNGVYYNDIQKCTLFSSLRHFLLDLLSIKRIKEIHAFVLGSKKLHGNVSLDAQTIKNDGFTSSFLFLFLLYLFFCKIEKQMKKNFNMQSNAFTFKFMYIEA